VKGSRSLVSWIVVFAAGFAAGVVFSAWKLQDLGGVTPSTPEAAPQAVQKDDMQNRIAGIERMLAANPNNLEALIQLGNDYYDIRNFEKAAEAYQKALQIDPRNPNVWSDLGAAFRRLGKPQDAVNSFRKSLEIDPNHSISLFNLGLVLRDDFKDYPAALKEWEQFLQKAGDSPHAVMVRPWVQDLRQKVEGAPGEAGSGTK
jgi:cytochrome c-type biogenesis protein CcmH/NrfG